MERPEVTPRSDELRERAALQVQVIRELYKPTGDQDSDYYAFYAIARLYAEYWLSTKERTVSGAISFINEGKIRAILENK